MPRVRGILAGGANATFEPFDRTGHEIACEGKDVDELLTEFEEARSTSLQELASLEWGPDKFSMPGQHPNFGAVRMDQLLAAGAAHDLSHRAQIARAMAHNHQLAVGPWAEFMPIVGTKTPPSH